jgi:hypothetical protein
LSWTLKKVPQAVYGFDKPKSGFLLFLSIIIALINPTAFLAKLLIMKSRLRIPDGTRNRRITFVDVPIFIQFFFLTVFPTIWKRVAVPEVLLKPPLDSFVEKMLVVGFPEGRLAVWDVALRGNWNIIVSDRILNDFRGSLKDRYSRRWTSLGSIDAVRTELAFEH